MRLSEPFVLDQIFKSFASTATYLLKCKCCKKGKKKLQKPILPKKILTDHCIYTQSSLLGLLDKQNNIDLVYSILQSVWQFMKVYKKNLEEVNPEGAFGQTNESYDFISIRDEQEADIKEILCYKY